MKCGQTRKRLIQKMRIFRGLENIHAVIDRHEAEWRKDNGEEPERPRLPSLEESVRRRLTAQPGEGSGRFAADRFLGGKTQPVKLKKPPMPEPAPSAGETETASLLEQPEDDTVKFSAERFLGVQPEPASTEPESAPEDSARHSWLYNEVMKAVNKASGDRKDTKIVAVFVPVIQDTGEAREIPADEGEFSDAENVQAVEIIRNKDGRHSRLYDEVMKAVNDSAGDSRKVVAVFVPLLQDGKEFEDLPADETVTLPPVSEDAVRIETASGDEAHFAPETESEADAAAETVAPEDYVIPEIPEPEAGVTAEILTPEAGIITEEIPAPESETEAPSAGDFDLIPEAETDAELVEAFREMEEKLDDALQEEHKQESVPEPEAEVIPETEPEPEAEVVLETEPEPEAEVVPETEPEPEAEVVLETEPEPEPETVPETEPEPEPEPEIILETEPEPEPEVVLETEPEPEAEVIPETEPEPEPEAEVIPETETEPEQEPEVIPEYDNEDDDDDDILSDGEPMEFEDIETVGQDDSDDEEDDLLALPDDLDDDSVINDGEFDESLTEIHRPDEREEPLILEEDEIEIIPDPS